MQTEEYQKTEKIESFFYLNLLTSISQNTTIKIDKIKTAINKLYKVKFIDVIVKKSDKLYVKILHNNISNYLIKQYQEQQEKQIKKTKNSIINRKQFKKPTVKEITKYLRSVTYSLDPQINNN